MMIEVAVTSQRQRLRQGLCFDLLMGAISLATISRLRPLAS